MNKETCTHISLYSVEFEPRTLFLASTDPHYLVSSFITALEGLATQSQSQLKVNYIEIETAIKIGLCGALEQLNQRQKRAERDMDFSNDCFIDSDEHDLTTNFRLMQWNHLIDIQGYLDVTVKCYQSLGKKERKL